MSRALLLVALIVLAGLLAGCTHRDDGGVRGPVYGVSVSPADQGERFARFWTDAEAVGSVIAWAGPMHELSDPRGGARVVAGLNADTGFHTAIMTGPYSVSDDALTEEYTNETRERHKQDLVDLVTDHRIAFLALGIELDHFAEDDPQNYTLFVAWWKEAYAAVKAASPHTHVFPVFQYERLIGLKGGLYGGVNDMDDSWHLVDDFPDRDMTGFTTYPGLVYKDPKEVPDDHYDAIQEHVEGDVAFTEIGWHAGERPPLWRSSEEEQARFVDRFFRTAPEHELALWIHLYDTGHQPPFDTMGLMRPDGVMRPALEKWRGHTGN